VPGTRVSGKSLAFGAGVGGVGFAGFRLANEIDFDKAIQQFTPGAAGIWIGVLMFGGWLVSQWIETRRLSLEDRLARREGYEKQVADLAKENRALRDELSLFRREHEDYRKLCHDETDSLRRQVVTLQNEITGLMRQSSAHAVAVAREVQRGGFDAPKASGAVERSASYLETPGDDSGDGKA
jgi:hypothetical protein